MGRKLVEFYERIEKRYKLAFFVTFAIGLLVHMFALTNKLPNHDYPFNIYSNQFDWPVTIGRCFMTVTTGISSFFTLPWLNGLLAVLYISLAVPFIIDLFDFKRTIPIILCSFLFVSYPAFTDTAGYICLEDGFMLALLISVIGVWFWYKKRGWVRVVAAALCLCFAAGVYQAYVAVAICLILVRLVLDVIQEKSDNKRFLIDAGSAALAGGVGMALYYACLMIIMSLTHTRFGTYMAVNEASVPTPAKAAGTLVKVFDEFVTFLVGTNSEFTAYEIFNIIFVLLFVVAFVAVIIRRKIYKHKLQFALLFVMGFLFVPGAYIFEFASEEVVYRFMMLYGVAFLYMLLIKVADEFLQGWFATVVAALSFVIAFNFAVIDNIAYENLNLCWEQTLATATMMEERITSVDGYSPDMQLMGQGTMQDEGRDWLRDRLPRELVGANDVNLMRDQSFIQPLLKTELGFTTDGVDEDMRNSIISSDEYLNMPVWPAGGSVKNIQGAIVVKLSD